MNVYWNVFLIEPVAQVRKLVANMWWSSDWLSTSRSVRTKGICGGETTVLPLCCCCCLPYYHTYHTYYHTYNGCHYGNSILTILTMPQCHSASTWGNFATILLLKLLHFYPTIMMFYPTTYLFLWWWNYSPVICCSENLCAASIILVAATAGNSGVSKHQ